jgi:hypothetical protein
MMKRTAVLAVLAAFSGATFCQGTPPGTKGQDWDQQTIEIQNGVEVEIKGQVTTKNTQSGNKSSVVLYIDGTEKRRAGGDKAEHTVTYRYSESGKHSVEIRCSNERADADTCSLDISKGSVKVFK